MFKRYLLWIAILATVSCNSFSSEKEKEVKDYAGWKEKMKQDEQKAKKESDLEEYAQKLIDKQVIPKDVTQIIFNNYQSHLHMFVLRNLHLLWPAVLESPDNCISSTIDIIMLKINAIKKGPMHKTGPSSPLHTLSKKVYVFRLYRYSLCDSQWTVQFVPFYKAEEILNFRDIISKYPEIYKVGSLYLLYYSDNSYSIHIHHSLRDKLANNYTLEQLQLFVKLYEREMHVLNSVKVLNKYQVTEHEWELFSQLDEQTQQNLRTNYSQIQFDLPRGLRRKAEFNRDDFFARF